MLTSNNHYFEAFNLLFFYWLTIISNNHFISFFSLFCLNFHFYHYRGDIDVKFPCDPKKFVKSANDSEPQNRLKEMKWKKDRALEDMQREQDLLDQAKFKYEIKKRELVRFIAESSSLMTQGNTELCTIIYSTRLFFL